MARKNQNIFLFIGLLLLGGVLHSLYLRQNSLMDAVAFSAEFLIYTGLVLFWRQSVNRRLLPSREKRYLLSAAGLMLLSIAAQLVKYRVAVSPGMIRYCWYVLYIPTLLIPTLFLMTCFRFLHGVERSSFELWFLLPAGLLILGFLTNDIHQMAFRPGEGRMHTFAFRPNIGLAGMIGESNTYTRGFLYYAAYAWAGGAMAAGVFLLMAACRRSGRWKKAGLPIFLLCLIPVALLLFGLIPRDSFPISYEWVEIVLFGMIGVFEACIRNRLIPSNEHDPDFFAQIELPALITDGNLNTVYMTNTPVLAAEDQMRASLKAPVSLTEHVRLVGEALRGGYAFHTEDFSAVHRMNEALREANDLLLEENEILAREQALEAEQISIQERSRLYQSAAREVYPAQKKISALLSQAEPGTASFRDRIEEVLVLNAYVKRKANFVLMESERDHISAAELAAALEESAYYLGYCGCHATVALQADSGFPCRQAMAMYDCFETVVEAMLNRTKVLYICLKNDELLMMADAAEAPELPETPIPLRISKEEGQLIFHVPV